MDLLVGRDVALDFTVLLDENKSCANQRNVTLQSNAICLRTLNETFMLFFLKKHVYCACEVEKDCLTQLDQSPATPQGFSSALQINC